MNTDIPIEKEDINPTGMRTFIIIWAGQLISLLGSGLTSFALGVWIFDQTGKATPFALTVLLGSLPRLLLLPVAGSLADRWNRRMMMILADTASAILTLAAFLLLRGGNLQFWMIYIIVILGSIAAAFQEPAYTASISMLVPKGELSRANGLMSLSQALESLISPLLAGFLFVTIGLRGIILIDFVTYFFAIGTLLVVRIPQPRIETPTGDVTEKPSVWKDAQFGWRYLRERSGLFGLLWFYALVNFFLNLSVVLLGPMVLSQHSPREYGMVQMAIGAGMLLGSITLSAWGGPKGRKIPAVIGFITLAGTGLAIAGLSPNVWVMISGMLLMLFSVPMASGPSQAIFQIKVAPDVQGRVFAIRSMISRSVMPLAFLIAGPLADRLLEPLMGATGALGTTFLGSWLGAGPGRGIGLGFVLSGLCLLVACAFAYANPNLRFLEDRLPDQV